MERNTTIPSLLGPAHEPVRSPAPTGGSAVLKFALWGLILAVAIAVYRYVKR